MSSKKNITTLTTGPFHIPAFNPFNNNRLIIIIKNPTHKSLSVSVQVDVCLAPAGNPTSPFNTVEDPFFSFPKSVIPKMSCTRIELDIPMAFLRSTFHVTTRGNYEVCDKETVCGGLEITVTGGDGIPSAPGLINADPNLFFRYENFVVCENKHH